ncbi:MAG TPA: DUF6635 family protein [Pseudolabrys sp.]|nr:DUF6635 family protein [Pseudolabrys sp.]
MPAATAIQNLPQLTAEEARRAVSQAARLYFESRRARVDAFVDRHFSLTGSLALHRHAVGWDVVKAPLNIGLAVPNFAVKLSAAAARAVRAKRVAGYLDSRRILLDTALGREIEWLIVTELLELPYRQKDRLAQKDALAETILASPHIQAIVNTAMQGIGRRAADPAFRERLEQATAQYADTRAAAAEIATALLALGTGAVALKEITPGALVLGPALAGMMAQQAAVASFPLGATLGRLWYAAFPVAASPGLIAGVTGGLMAIGAVAAAFSGIVTDPVQRRLGFHRRRLLRLIDSVERQFNANETGGFVTRDHYVARLLSLVELLASAYGLAR